MQEVEHSVIQPLLSTVTSTDEHPASLHADATSKDSSCCKAFSTCLKNHRVCRRSGAAILILLWNIVVGLVYGILQVAIIAVSVSSNLHPQLRTVHRIQIAVAGIAGIAVVQIILFPLGGLLADIWQGRYRIIHFSFVKITLGFLLFCAGIALSVSIKHPHNADAIAFTLCTLLLSLGFAGFQSNAIQFGLDQLQDASNQELSFFLHWYVWTGTLGESMARFLGTVTACGEDKTLRKYYVYPPSCFAAICLLLLFLCWYIRRSFHCEPKCDNPYGAVLKVLKFVAKHKYPLRRSAQTYCGDMTPTRMDYANIVFGGPFSVEVVEDVKTFLRMVAMMLMICPVFFYDVSVSSLFPLYGIHLGGGGKKLKPCRARWILFESGNISNIVSCLIIPFYIIFLFPKLTRLLPRILHRLVLGIMVLVAAVVIMWLYHLIAIAQNYHTVQNDNETKCLFFEDLDDQSGKGMNLHSALFAIPEILIGIAFPLVNISVLEFVSAQSPYPMKGLLLGTFYALRGIFILLGCSFTIIFTTNIFEQARHFMDCGFIFYGMNVFLGFVFLFIALRAIKWYQYRKREETPYDHRYVEDYYSRYASKVVDSTHDDTTDESQHNYGTWQNPDRPFTVNSE